MNEFTLVSVKLIHMSCGKCGIQFAMDEAKYDRCKKKGEDWYCPNGHGRVFTNPENKKLERQVNDLTQSLEYFKTANSNLHNQLVTERHKVRAEKSAKTRLKNRVKHGVCPCCNRTFKQLAAHMKIQHPEYVEQ